MGTRKRAKPRVGKSGIAAKKRKERKKGPRLRQANGAASSEWTRMNANTIRTPDERKMNGVQEVAGVRGVQGVGWALWRRVRKDATGESLLFPRNIPPRETTLLSRFQRETLT